MKEKLANAMECITGSLHELLRMQNIKFNLTRSIDDYGKIASFPVAGSQSTTGSTVPYRPPANL